MQVIEWNSDNKLQLINPMDFQINERNTLIVHKQLNK